MIDYYLKFADEAEAKTILSFAVDEAGNWVTHGVYTYADENEEIQECRYDLDIIGTLYAPTGNTVIDEEGNEYPETQAIAGFHVNARLGVSSDAVAAYDQAPAKPSRVWG